MRSVLQHRAQGLSLYRVGAPLNGCDISVQSIRSSGGGAARPAWLAGRCADPRGDAEPLCEVTPYPAQRCCEDHVGGRPLSPGGRVGRRPVYCSSASRTATTANANANRHKPPLRHTATD